jgi:hypothetical protein
MGEKLKIPNNFKSIQIVLDNDMRRIVLGSYFEMQVQTETIIPYWNRADQAIFFLS